MADTFSFIPEKTPSSIEEVRKGMYDYLAIMEDRIPITIGMQYLLY